MPTEREVGVDPELERRQPDLLEPGDRAPGRSSRSRSPRAPGRATEHSASRSRSDASAARPRASRLRPSSTSRSKRCRSSCVGLDPDEVAGRSGRQHVLRQRLAQPRDVDPQRGGSVLGRVVAPELVDQPVGGDDLVGMEQEHGEERTRLGPANGDLAVLRPTPRAVPGSGTPSGRPPGPDANSGCCRSETALKWARSIIGDSRNSRGDRHESSIRGARCPRGRGHADIHRGGRL